MPSRIDSHRPLRMTARRKRTDDRPSAAARGYCTTEHAAWKKSVHARDAWQCVTCGRVVTGRQAHADHIVPIAAGGARYDLSNGQTLCRPCHSRKTAKESVKKT